MIGNALLLALVLFMAFCFVLSKNGLDPCGSTLASLWNGNESKWDWLKAAEPCTFLI